MKILCIGDSNTYGYDPHSYLESRYPADVRWTDRLKGHEVINSGVNGMTVPRNHFVYEAMIRDKQPDLITVMLGTNDVFTSDAEVTVERMGRFLTSICKHGKPVLLIAPPPVQGGDWVPSAEPIEESMMLGDLYRELAEEKDCIFADAGAWGIELAFDGVHFSPAGHETFAEKLQALLDEYESGEL